MTKLIMWNLISLDGFFEGAKNWDLDFHQSVWGDELESLSLEQLRSADGPLFGRITYEGMAAYWQTATGEIADFMNRLPKVVVSRTLERPNWTNTRLIGERVLVPSRASTFNICRVLDETPRHRLQSSAWAAVIA